MPAHRRPLPPPPRPATGVLAAILVGSVGLGVAFTAAGASGPDPVSNRAGGRFAQGIGRAAPAALSDTPIGSPVSAGPTDVIVPMSPAAAETSVPPPSVAGSGGTGAVGPVATADARPRPYATPSRTPRSNPHGSTPGRPTPTSSGPTPTPSATPVPPTPSPSPSETPSPSSGPGDEPTPTPTPTPTPSVSEDQDPTATDSADPTGAALG
ncbi:hypothetical protein OG792_17150 [Micromonospora sp. NBC_01699]|uniref:hypothetical protein n=1 Tax=Micromonospora sp. NBC_01699 TaxID=2975984 RepID=UPI002E2FB6D8|nr:hypothetical protein [Micromonospora sp. NBC_01699]